MIEITTYKFLSFTKKEIWYYNGETVTPGTYTTYCYSQHIFEAGHQNELKEFTTTIDLSKAECELFNALNEPFKYEIKKAERSGFYFDSLLSPTLFDCKKMIASFNIFSKNKGIGKINTRRIIALQKTNTIVLTTIKKENTDVVTHVYLFDKGRALLLHSFHHPNKFTKQIMGEANKYLHWKDILLFKEKGIKIYDFGGINPEKVPGISQFKLNFGGIIEPVSSYTFMIPVLKPFYKFYKFISGNK